MHPRTQYVSDHVAYRPMGEEFRQDIIKYIFKFDVSLYPRKNYAFGFAPIPINNPSQQIIQQKVKKDGNCFYSSLAQIFFGKPDMERSVRRVIYNYAKQHKKRIPPPYDNNPKAIDDIMQDKEWATDYVQMISCMLFNSPEFTKIYNSQYTGWFDIKTSWPEKQLGVLDYANATYLIHENSNHYQPVHVGVQLMENIIVFEKGNGSSSRFRLPIPTLTPGKKVYADRQLTRKPHLTGTG